MPRGSNIENRAPFCLTIPTVTIRYAAVSASGLCESSALKIMIMFKP